ncbi:glycosyltransferase family 1 protein [Corallincola holothuriorum]|uniref:Glycosyltransferase family 1 protein n=1 Tax=Corallincola holothuriorum TaxID=2282215 RepID=A0A368N6L1_9GAMM|nr:glycosyltransferase family 4 protein [Corallincola holothuriorum]RCU45155.1 glycosyltransferase family 1 protein [Corallincola holothuriorum]
MKKSVLLIVRWPISGIRNYLRYVYQTPYFNDYEFTIVAPDLDFSRYFGEYLSSSRFTLKAAEASLKGIAKATRAVMAEKDFDLVHSHGFTSSVATVIPVTLAKKKHILTVHDVFQPGQFHAWYAPAKKWLLTRIFRQMDHVTTVSKDCAENLYEYLPGMRGAPVTPILNGIDTEYFKQSTAIDLQREYEQCHGRFLIGFMGRFMSQKGFRYLIDAIASLSKDKTLPSKPLIVAFGSVSGFVREDRALIEEKGLNEYFTFLPYTDDVGGSMKGLDMIAMPSLWEACGLLAMEALCAGVPIVATNCVGLREVLKDTPAWQVEPRNAEQIADAIRSLMLNPEQRTRFEAFADIACTRYSVDSAAKALADVYLKVESSK